MLKESVGWKLGNGKNVNVWGEPWLRHKGHAIIWTPPTNGLEDLKVGVLMDKEALCWNYTLLTQIFEVQDVEAILRTPLLNVDQQDTKIWDYTPNGVYSVKSAYKVIMNELVDNEHLAISSNWRLIWRVNVPPWVRNLMWRICEGNIPTRTTLNSRGVLCLIVCLLCEVEV